MTYVLFVADKFSDELRSKKDRFPGGAERTDEAAIEACPYPVKQIVWDKLEESLIQASVLVVVGNSGSAKASHFAMLTKFRKHVLFEHDVRICHWRGNFPVAAEPMHRFSHKCLCPHLGMRDLFESALGVIYLTELQKKYYDENRFFNDYGRSAILGSSLFDAEFLDYVDNVSANVDKKDTLIPGTSTKIKGAKQAESRCKEKGWKFTKVKNFTPKEVWEAMHKAERFVYLPIGLEPAGRMPVEARLLGCEVIVNENVGVAEDPIWKLDDTEFERVLRKQPDYFWTLVGGFSPSFKNLE